MKIGISGDHCAFLEHNGFISFESVVSKPEALFQELASFHTPRDICRQSHMMKTKLAASKMPAVASLLLKEAPIRYGFDALFSSKTWPNPCQAIENCFCVQPLSLLMIIAASQGVVIPHTITPFHMTYADLPTQPGDILCLLPSVQWDMTAHYNGEERLFWCIGFTGPSPTYVWNTQDPYSHLLKGCGYIPNETLNEITHPYF